MGPQLGSAMSRFKAHISGYVLLLLLLSPMSHAHNRSQSFSVWSIDGPEVNAVFTVKAREVTRLLALEPTVAPNGTHKPPAGDCSG